MRVQNLRGINKMSKYLNQNYYVGSIMERANYKKRKHRTYKVYGALIESDMNKKDTSTLWQKVKKIILK